MQHKITTFKRRVLLLCPLPLVLFVTLVFWTLGGGQPSSTPELSMLENFNYQMPNANPNRSAPENKLSYYKEADAKKVTWNTMPYRDSAKSDLLKKSDILLHIPSQYDIAKTSMVLKADMAEKEQRLHNKLQTLQQLVSQNDPGILSRPNGDQNLHTNPSSNVDLERLEEIMVQLSSPQTKDPELTQLNELLETVLDIQHPKRVTKRLADTKNRKLAAYVKPAIAKTSIPISYLGEETSTLADDKKVGFYSVAGMYRQEQALQNTIAAVIHKAQDVTEGSKVTLRLDQEITLEDITIAKGHLIYAIASIHQERLFLTIDGIKHGFNQFPVSLVAYGTDGLKGIYIPGAIGRKESKESGGNFLQRLGISPFNNSIEGQITRTGIQATKRIFSKKVKEQRVRVKTGDRVFLKYE